jgi:hypothetical protein
MSGWFFMLGEPLTEDERTHAGDYVRGLGIHASLPLEHVADWNAARNVIKNPAWDRRLWDAERLEMQRLYGRAREARAVVALQSSLSRTLQSGEAVHGAAAVAAARGGCSDVGLIYAAAGAASEALHFADLARLAGENEAHPFFSKQALFAAGHWPLGAVEGRYYVF